MKRNIDWFFLGLGLIAAAIALFCIASCAIPVRPVAKVVPDTDGSLHFVPDAKQEPHAPAGLMAAISAVLSQLGPMGQLGAIGVAALGGGAIHTHGRRKGKKDATATATAPKATA
jgi:outer membrane lipoprotein SlyB